MQTSESFSRDVLRVFVWYPVRWLIAALPVKLGMAVMRTMGDLHYLLSKGKKKLIAQNILRAKAEGGGAINAVREYFRNHYVDRLLIFVFPKFGLREIEKFVEIEGLEILDKALDRGSGVILVHGHFGPVHLPLVVLSRLGYRMQQIGLPSDEGLSWVGKKVSFRLRLKYEDKIPAEILKADGFLRGTFRWLRDNGIVMITGDGSGTTKRIGRHAEFSFLAWKAMFPLGPYLLAEKTGAAIMPLFIVPGQRKSYRIVLEPPLTSVLSGHEKIMDITGQFIRRMEHYISRFPGYLHFLDRFGPDETMREY